MRRALVPSFSRVDEFKENCEVSFVLNGDLRFSPKFGGGWVLSNASKTVLEDKKETVFTVFFKLAVSVGFRT